VEGTTPKVLTLTGQRLVDRTTMRATGPGGTFTVPTLVVGGGLQAALDLTTAAPGVWTLRVVSPDGVISNQRTFGVTIAKAVLSRVTPAAVAAGAQVTLRLEGQHLMVASHCLVSGVGLAEREVPATLRSVVVGSGAQDVLDCDLDLTGFSPGGYSVRVRNSETLVSDPLGFQVVTSSPSISDVAPNSAGPGTTPLVLVFGTGFDGSSTVWLKGPGFAVAQRTEPLSATQLRVPALDLTKCPTAPCALSSAIAPQQYTLEVRNSGAGGAVIPSTEVVPFVIESSGRTYARISPTSAFQGDQPVVRLLGTNLTGGVLEYAPPGGTFQPALAQQTAADGSYVEGRLDLVGTAPDYAPAGSWSIRLAFTAGATTTYSPSFTLRVDSNQAVILTTPSPAGGQAGQSVRVKLTAVNLRPPIAGVRVRFYDPTPATLPGFTRDLTPELPTQDAVTGIWTVFVTLDLAGRDTKVHALRLVNPNGAAPSAPYNFTVSPGLPRVDTVACTSLKPAGPCTDATHAQQKGIIPIRITGANFAMPDLAGNNGSQVRVSSAAVAVTDFLIPPAAVTVVSAGEITVQLDTTLAVLQVVNNQQVDTAYALEVWNPGAGLQSAPFANAFILTP
jgi:hypothetical protein